MLNFLFFDGAKVLRIRHFTKKKHFARLAKPESDLGVTHYIYSIAYVFIGYRRWFKLCSKLLIFYKLCKYFLSKSIFYIKFAMIISLFNFHSS